MGRAGVAVVRLGKKVPGGYKCWRCAAVLSGRSHSWVRCEDGIYRRQDNRGNEEERAARHLRAIVSGSVPRDEPPYVYECKKCGAHVEVDPTPP